MNQSIIIGIIGDLAPAHPSRIATDTALAHAAAALSATVECSWLPTPLIEKEGAEPVLAPFGAVWCAPGSPYESMEGALEGIRFTRERGKPFVAT